MNTLSVGLVLCGLLSTSCRDNTSKFTGKWLPNDKKISPIIIGQQAGKMTCIIDSVKRFAEYDSDNDELVANYEIERGCLRFTSTYRIKYLFDEKKIAMIQGTGFGQGLPNWNKYSKQP
ncbi:MAG TPA: hypothetical protein VK364_09180 [Hymenobacter sp.]|nr:hypothetical protein [Hymenobacter sp.]